MTTTTRAEQIALNEHVLKALGLNDQHGLLTEVVLTLQPGKLPTVRLERALRGSDLAEISSETAWLELQLANVDTAPLFDVAAECEAALVRVGAAIDVHAASAFKDIQNSFSALKPELLDRIDRAEAALAIRRRLRNMLAPFV